MLISAIKQAENRSAVNRYAHGQNWQYKIVENDSMNSIMGIEIK